MRTLSLPRIGILLLLVGLVWFSSLSLLTAAAASQGSPTLTTTPRLPALPGLYLPFAWQAPSPSQTPTPTASPTPTVTPQPGPPEEALFCRSESLAIPDGGSVEDRIQLPEGRIVLDVDVYVKIDHPYVGDIAIEFIQRSSEIHTILVDRSGVDNTLLHPSKPLVGCSGSNIQAIFDDNASQLAEEKCLSGGLAAIGGAFRPTLGLAQFNHQPAGGDWSLLVSDTNALDTGSLKGWCIKAWLGDETPTPTPTPTPTSLPASKILTINGKGQALPLDCETRSAVDWAAYFKVAIDEMTFVNQLPLSDDPDWGFVGDVNGVWGQIPPNDYGIHAMPVAALLRAYGLTASGQRGWQWQDIQAEIAAGRPVITWITQHVGAGAPEYYRAPSTQNISVVARYEHTVIVYGYSETEVYILDGANKYTRSLDDFLDSWSALGNMAVLARR